MPVSTFFEDTSQNNPDDAIEMLLNSEGAIDLLRAYATIPDEEMRRSILMMVKASLRVANASKPATAGDDDERPAEQPPAQPSTH